MYLGFQKRRIAVLPETPIFSFSLSLCYDEWLSEQDEVHGFEVVKHNADSESESEGGENETFYYNPMGFGSLFLSARIVRHN